LTTTIQFPASPQRVPSKVRQSSARLAARDLWEGLTRIWLWGLLAWYDIKHRYRGSVLGPFWLTLSTAIMIGSLGLLYSQLFKTQIADLLPFLSLGIVTWGLISALIGEGCSALFSVENVVKQIKMPLSIYIYRMAARNVIVFGHNIVVVIAVLVFFHVPVGLRDLLAIPGLAMVVVTCIPIALVLAMFCARFRDMPQMVASLLQVGFFVTPIMWKPEMLGSHAWVANDNPFNALIDIVRAPLLGQFPAAHSWPLACLTLIVCWAIAFPFFARFRARVAYWI
jgi:ABC-type polysaccharide/polyol phosphate export permease